jgi:excisionase family DNA binding protein
MMDAGRFIVLVPIQELPRIGVAEELRERASGLRARQVSGEASAEEVLALRALDTVLSEGQATPANGNGNGAAAGGATLSEPSLLLKVEDVARLLEVSRPHAYNLVARGEIPSVRIGGKCLRVRRDQLLAWLDEQAVTQGGQVGARP